MTLRGYTELYKEPTFLGDSSFVLFFLLIKIYDVFGTNSSYNAAQYNLKLPNNYLKTPPPHTHTQTHTFSQELKCVQKL